MHLFCDLLVYTVIHHRQRLLLVDFLHILGELVIAKETLGWHRRDIHLVFAFSLLGAIRHRVTVLFSNVCNVAKRNLMVGFTGR